MQKALSKTNARPDCRRRQAAKIETLGGPNTVTRLDASMSAAFYR
jgi:hypothetical protein